MGLYNYNPEKNQELTRYIEEHLADKKWLFFSEVMDFIGNDYKEEI